jgi:ribose transport system substrate-binding protein
MRRGELWWINFPRPVGRRPGLILEVQDDGAGPVALVAPSSRQVRGTADELELTPEDGVAEPSVLRLGACRRVPTEWIDAVVAAALLLCLLAGCQEARLGPTEPIGQADFRSVGGVLPELEEPFWARVCASLQEAAGRADLDLEVRTTYDGAAGQVAAVEQLLQGPPRVLLVAPVGNLDPAAVIATAQKARRPLVALQQPWPKGGAVSWVGLEEAAAGRQMGIWLSGQLQQARASQGALLAVQAVADEPAAQPRLAGFAQVIRRAKLLLLKLSLDEDDEADLGGRLGTMLASQPSIKAVFVPDERLAGRIVQSLEVLQRPELAVVTCGARRATLEAVQSRRIQATVAPDAAMLGEQGIAVAHGRLQNQAVPARVPVKPVVITVGNVEQWLGN